MKSTRPRNWLSFSLRTMLIVVTLCCLGIVWWQRTSRFESRRAVHAQMAQQFADVAWGMQRFRGFSADANDEASPFWEQHQHHAELAEQYRRAAWLGFVPSPVEGEPPHQGLLQTETVASS